jgi:Flp pilus assembly protein TadG
MGRVDVATKTADRKSLLSRLRTDTAGNTIAIAAASLVPLVGMVGGAVDVSRYYMSTSRLQNACDSGALAARKAMGNDSFNATHRGLAETFFDQNFADGTFGATSRTRTFTGTADGEVNGVATAQLPVPLMGAFGFGDFSLSVTCQADINISNTDIVFVLDVTGSMNTTDSSGKTRIQGLREAVMTFYDTVDDATSSSAQVRYGIVPYASNVNVGFSIPTQYLADTHTYQSREANVTTTTSQETTSFVQNNVTYRSSESRNGFSRTQRYRNVNSSSACLAKPLPDAFTDRLISGSFQGSTLNILSDNTVGTTRTVNYDITADFRRGEPVHYYNRKRKRCDVGHELYEYEATGNFTQVLEVVVSTDFDNWTYKPVEFDISAFKTGGQVITPTGYEGADVAHTWTGCIEEADTVNDATFDPVPAGANDLDINLVPSNASEYWKPQLPQAVYRRENPGNTTSHLTQTGDERLAIYDCPKQAERLAELDRDYLVEYLKASNGFDANSNTYHDIGMIWGARFISPNGMFKADNETAPNGDAISRHIVFMTDGFLVPYNETYTPYGVEFWDRRIGTNGSNEADRHAARFQAACKAARQENISVWVVAFGTTLGQNLLDCATPGRAFEASNSTELDERFKEIAEKIAALRLTE